MEMPKILVRKRDYSILAAGGIVVLLEVFSIVALLSRAQVPSQSALPGSTSCTSQSCSFESDLNTDGKVGNVDLSILAANYGNLTSSGDINGDGQVNNVDFSMLASNWGTTLCNGTSVAAGSDLVSLTNSAAAGTTFCLAPGTYAQQKIVPKDGNTYIGLGKVTLDGAKPLSGFTKSGNVWMISGQTQRGPVKSGGCSGDLSIKCVNSEDLFVDGTFKTRLDPANVASLASVTSGTWLFDYSGQFGPANTIYIGDDPTGKTVETSYLDYAFSGLASNVTIRHLAVEKYANTAQTGALMVGNGQSANQAVVSGWQVDQVTAQLNHGAGVGFNRSDGTIVKNSRMNDNGQLGIKGMQSTNAQVLNNELARNNALRFDYTWEAGGSKFSRTNTLLVQGNYSHDNWGPGLWTDIENYHTTYDSNTVLNNASSGIMHEISYDAQITNNVITHNGFNRQVGTSGLVCAGAGITVSTSGDLSATPIVTNVSGNILTDNARAIVGLAQDRVSPAPENATHYLRNLNVHGNITNNTASNLQSLSDPSAIVNQSITGVCNTGSDNPFAVSANNSFSSNTYQSDGNIWHWSQTGLIDFPTWQADGQY